MNGLRVFGVAFLHNARRNATRSAFSCAVKPMLKRSLENLWPFRPATPLIRNVFVLNSCCPRAIERRACVNGSFSELFSELHALNSVNTFGVNAALLGFRPTGSLIPVKKGCRDTACGP